LIDLLTSGPKEIISIVSTAGTGKTTFLYYFAIRYLREQQENTKILIRIMKTQTSYLLSSVCEEKSAVKLLGCCGTLEAFPHEMNDPAVLQLVDCCDAFPAPIPRGSVRAVAFFSPRTWEYRHGEWRKVSKQLYVACYCGSRSANFLLYQVLSGVDAARNMGACCVARHSSKEVGAKICASWWNSS